MKSFAIDQKNWDLLAKAAPHRDNEWGIEQDKTVALNFDNNEQICDYLRALEAVRAELAVCVEMAEPIVTMKIGKVLKKSLTR